MTVTKDGRQVEVTTVGQLIEELKRFDGDKAVIIKAEVNHNDPAVENLMIDRIKLREVAYGGCRIPAVEISCF